MNHFSRRGDSLGRLAGCCCLAAAVAGCGELRGRARVREGNRLYREGRYAEALDQYRRAETLAPRLPPLWLNEGLTCRQMMIPGARTVENQKAVDCAVAAFDRMKKLAPDDPRGEQLYVQTLFDGDRFETLAARYGAQLKANPTDLAAINGIIQVYSRWNRPDESLAWYQRKAALLPKDAEAQYSVGVFVWQQLYQRGGGPDHASFDPRPVPADAVAVPGARRRRAATPAKPAKPPPAFSPGDITGSRRVAMADLGIGYLERARSLRANYQEAMVYLSLLHRQKAMAYFDQPERWQAAIDDAERWRHQAGGARDDGQANGQTPVESAVNAGRGDTGNGHRGKHGDDSNGNIAAEKGAAPPAP